MQAMEIDVEGMGTRQSSGRGRLDLGMYEIETARVLAASLVPRPVTARMRLAGSIVETPLKDTNNIPSLGTRPFARGRRKGSGHHLTFELSSQNVITRGN